MDGSIFVIITIIIILIIIIIINISNTIVISSSHVYHWQYNITRGPKNRDIDQALYTWYCERWALIYAELKVQRVGLGSLQAHRWWWGWRRRRWWWWCLMMFQESKRKPTKIVPCSKQSTGALSHLWIQWYEGGHRCHNLTWVQIMLMTMTTIMSSTSVVAH